MARAKKERADVTAYAIKSNGAIHLESIRTSKDICIGAFVRRLPIGCSWDSEQQKGYECVKIKISE